MAKRALGNEMNEGTMFATLGESQFNDKLSSPGFDPGLRCLTCTSVLFYSVFRFIITNTNYIEFFLFGHN